MKCINLLKSIKSVIIILAINERATSGVGFEIDAGD
jgi:hypothetical protein